MTVFSEEQEMNSRHVPRFRHPVKPDFHFFDVKLDPHIREVWDWVLFWTKAGSFFFSVIGVMALASFSIRQEIPFPLSLSVLGTFVLAVGAVTSLVVAAMFGLFMLPRLAQLEFLGPEYPALFVKADGTMVGRLKRFGLFPLICYVPAGLAMACALVVGSDHYSQIFGAIYLTWIGAVTWCIGGRKWSWSLAWTVLILNAAVFVGCLLLVLIAWQEIPTPTIFQAWMAITALVAVAIVQILFAGRWLPARTRGDRIDHDREMRIRARLREEFLP